MQTPKAILFDLDNTLYEYEPCNVAGTKEVHQLLSQSLNVSKKRVAQEYIKARKRIHAQLKGQAASHSRLLYIQYVIEQVTGKSQPKLAQTVTKSFWKVYLTTMKLRPGIKQLLLTAHNKGIVMALVTDLTTEIQISKINQLRIVKYFHSIVTSEEAGAEKPDTIMIKIALRKLSVSANQTVLIGDSLTKDKAVANTMNISFLRINSDKDVASVHNTLFS